MVQTNEGVRRLANECRRHGPALVARRLATPFGTLRHWADGTRRPSTAARAMLQVTLGIPTDAWDWPIIHSDGSAPHFNEIDSLDLADVVNANRDPAA